jgi:hypothetical protein
MTYAIQLSWNNQAERFFLPVLPEKLNTNTKGQGKTYDVIKTGQINSIQGRELSEISFKSFFPATWQPFVDVKPEFLLKPSEYVNYINKWWKTNYPIRFIYVGPQAQSGLGGQIKKPDISLPVSIESFETWEEGGSPGDIFFSLKLKEYVFYSARRITAVEKDGQTVLRTEPPQRPDERVPNTSYALKPRDTLIKVARMELGNSGRWREIQLLNGITDSEIKRLQVGRVLQLPKK